MKNKSCSHLVPKVKQLSETMTIQDVAKKLDVSVITVRRLASASQKKDGDRVVFINTRTKSRIPKTSGLYSENFHMGSELLKTKWVSM